MLARADAPLIWDGAYQFSQSLVDGRPYAYLTRFHSLILWSPMVWASHFTANVMVLQAIFGLPFLLAPFITLLLSWWIVRDRAPRLILWVVFGVAAGTLPGQIFVINDSLLQHHLFWPIFMAVFVPLTWPKRIVLGVLAVFQFSHPLGAPLFLSAGIAAVMVAVVDRAQRRRLLWAAGTMFFLCGLAAAKIVITKHIPRWHDTYAEQEATWERAKSYWIVAVRGEPIRGLRWMWLAGIMAFLQPLLRRYQPRFASAAGVLGIICVLIAAGHWINWAYSPIDSWGGAICYRRWFWPLTLPFYALATAEAILLAWNRDRRVSPDALLASPEARSVRGPMAILVALTFALVLGMQCRSWSRLTDRLIADLQSDPAPIVPQSAPSLEWIGHTPLNHWATPYYVMVMQGKVPAKIFIDASTEEKMRDDPTAWRDYVAEHARPPGPGGWYDYRPLLRKANLLQSPNTRSDE